MLVTSEKIEARLKKLQQDRLQSVGIVAAYDGAMQDCKYWLEELAKVEAE